jgi:acetylornithine deacetylase/succinyl-diaminopimelate desuccinylase-like protein
VNLIHICCIFLLMGTLSPRPTEDSIKRLAHEPHCQRGLEWIDKYTDWVTGQQIRMTEIPAPEFGEARRGELLGELLKASSFSVRVDETGNVIGERPGSDVHSVILIAAHLDTVFPPGTDTRVKRNGDRLEAPGISDNGAGLGAVVGLARALFESRIHTTKTLVLVGDVGEEGEGNLRGVRALVDSYGSRLAAVIAVDGASTDYITTQGVASRRFEVTVTGPGGHSWSDFGQPNPITALSRGLVEFSAIRVPGDPRSSYNFGVFEGGTSVNSIPARALVKIDIRSEAEAELGRLEEAMRQAMQAGVAHELAATHAPSDSLQLSFRSLGARPAGRLPDDSPLLETVRAVDRFLGNPTHLERSSTDANIPLSLGIPAIALGGGGKGGGSHTRNEWYTPQGRELGLKRLYLTSLALAGVEP